MELGGGEIAQSAYISQQEAHCFDVFWLSQAK